MHIRHVATLQDKISLTSELLNAGLITQARVSIISYEEAAKLNRLTPLILSGKLKLFNAYSYDDAQVNKLQRLTPLIAAGEIEIYQVLHLAPDKIEKLEKLSDLILADKIKLYQALSMATFKAVNLYVFKDSILKGEREVFQVLSYNALDRMSQLGLPAYQMLFIRPHSNKVFPEFEIKDGVYINTPNLIRFIKQPHPLKYNFFTRKINKHQLSIGHYNTCKNIQRY